jgi:hypothetical protein
LLRRVLRIAWRIVRTVLVCAAAFGPATPPPPPPPRPVVTAVKEDSGQVKEEL